MTSPTDDGDILCHPSARGGTTPSPRPIVHWGSEPDVVSLLFTASCDKRLQV
jgi:hypothetical protein